MVGRLLVSVALSAALGGCYEAHGQLELDAGEACSSDAGGRCLTDRPCWCRLGDDGLAYCSACLEECGAPGDIHAGGCELRP